MRQVMLKPMSARRRVICRDWRLPSGLARRWRSRSPDRLRTRTWPPSSETMRRNRGRRYQPPGAAPPPRARAQTRSGRWFEFTFQARRLLGLSYSSWKRSPRINRRAGNPGRAPECDRRARRSMRRWRALSYPSCVSHGDARHGLWRLFSCRTSSRVSYPSELYIGFVGSGDGAGRHARSGT